MAYVAYTIAVSPMPLTPHHLFPPTLPTYSSSNSQRAGVETQVWMTSKHSSKQKQINYIHEAALMWHNTKEVHSDPMGVLLWLNAINSCLSLPSAAFLKNTPPLFTALNTRLFQSFSSEKPVYILQAITAPLQPLILIL